MYHRAMVETVKSGGDTKKRGVGFKRLRWQPRSGAEFTGSTTRKPRWLTHLPARICTPHILVLPIKAARAPLPTATLCVRGIRRRGQGVETSGGACRRISFPPANNPFKEGHHQ